MNIIASITRMFRKSEAPRVLRNKPGGMAWIKGLDANYGAEALNNRAVKTISVDALGRWRIEPPQEWIATANFRMEDGFPVWRGSELVTSAICDECLEPWRDDGITTEDVTELYAPSAPEKVENCNG